jgi:predicted RNase H-like nuclease
MTPARQRLVREAHPELAFATMAGAPMRHPKRTAPGRRERLRALRALGAWDDALDAGPPPGAAWDDLLDACALAWTADRLGRGEALVLGGARDARGLRMEICA